MNLSLLASGGLGLQLLKYIFSFHKIDLVATDKDSLDIIQFAKTNDIPCFIGVPRSGKLKKVLGNSKRDTLLSINYLFLIEDDVINSFKYAINLHGSLLPKYRGRTPHVWSIINNEKVTGVTAHLIDQGCDTGDIILQKKVSIEENDTGADILGKYSLLYPIMISEIIEKIENKKLLCKPQNHSKATVYGKRVPDDGRINWNWQKERIRNWVRAQAYPYPGAYTYFEGKKIVIDKVEHSSLGFNNNIPNGSIITVSPELVVKTTNGALTLLIIRDNNINFETNKVLGE